MRSDEKYKATLERRARLVDEQNAAADKAKEAEQKRAAERRVLVDKFGRVRDLVQGAVTEKRGEVRRAGADISVVGGETMESIVVAYNRIVPATAPTTKRQAKLRVSLNEDGQVVATIVTGQYAENPAKVEWTPTPSEAFENEDAIDLIQQLVVEAEPS